MSEKNNNELAVNEGFAVLANQNVLNEALAEDCQGLEFSFDRVKLPAGGGTAFELPSAESDESEMVKDITGVIVYNHPAYAYYHDKYTGGNNPPDCGSFDGVTGIGNPGGNCADCPYNKFGSGDGQSNNSRKSRDTAFCYADDGGVFLCPYSVGGDCKSALTPLQIHRKRRQGKSNGQSSVLFAPR